MKRHRSLPRTTRHAAPLLAAALLLAACESVEFEGKPFELLGLNQKAQKENPNMPERAPLVVPPKRDLPEPGPREQIANPGNWPNDPNIAREKQVAAAKQQARKRCGERPLKRTHIYEWEGVADPMANCAGFLSKKVQIDDSDRGDGSPDKLVEQPDDAIPSKKKPADSAENSPWRAETVQAKPGN